MRCHTLKTEPQTADDAVYSPVHTEFRGLYVLALLYGQIQVTMATPVCANLSGPSPPQALTTDLPTDSLRKLMQAAVGKDLGTGKWGLFCNSPRILPGVCLVFL